ncbi:hypothetical protein RP20_CCG014282 [Aedes albopictus]|nr:hypothetical protein RP20_CCG014282 [Aedes albopictus]
MLFEGTRAAEKRKKLSNTNQTRCQQSSDAHTRNRETRQTIVSKKHSRTHHQTVAAKKGGKSSSNHGKKITIFNPGSRLLPAVLVTTGCTGHRTTICNKLRSISSGIFTRFHPRDNSNRKQRDYNRSRLWQFLESFAIFFLASCHFSDRDGEFGSRDANES